MGKLQLAGGVEVDFASGDDVKAGIDRILNHAETAERSGKPLYQTRWGASVTPSAGPSTTVIKLGRPSAGKIWNVVFLTVTGPDDHTAVAGATVASYVGNPDDPTLHTLVEPANGTAVPKSSSFSEKEVWVHDTDELFLIVYGAPNNTQLSAVARVLEWNAEAIEARR